MICTLVSELWSICQPGLGQTGDTDCWLPATDLLPRPSLRKSALGNDLHGVNLVRVDACDLVAVGESSL